MAYYPMIISNCTPRHKHPLSLCEGLSPFKCNGCKEYGANTGYCCSSCPNITLHEVCGAYPDSYVHPFYPNYEFRFRKKTLLSHKCDACGEDLRGFVYEAATGNLLKPLRFHPLCIVLPTVINYGGHKEHPLRLIMETGGTFCCSRCNENKSGWSYRCDEMECRLRVDLVCVKVDNHALSDHGIASMNRSSFKR